MAKLVSIVPLQPVAVARRTHSAFELTAHQLTPVGTQATALWVIEHVPLYFTITLVEIYLEAVGGLPSWSLALRSDLPTELAPWNEIAVLSGPSPFRQQPGLRVTAPCRRLVAEASVASAPPQTVFRARISIVDDHF